ncbi:MAG: UDP-N-acetylmuramate dehydrogenase [Thermodesulfobacteriota bacterium]
MTEQFGLFLDHSFKGRVLFEVSMKDYTSLGVGGAADVMAFPENEADLKQLLKFAAAKKFQVFFLGGGTNLLVRDGGVRGIIINLSEGFKETDFSADGAVKAGVGVKLSGLSKECAERGLTGLEFATGIPGTVGGAAVMNAGAYGAELKDVVVGIEVMTLKGKKGFIPKADIEFGYRSSKLPEDVVITRVQMMLADGDRDEINKRVEEIRASRKDTSSVVGKNAGCIYKNPEGESAGKLIDEAGLKGERSGGAEISGAHANYIVNTGDATARDVLTLMALIRDKVYSTRGIVLEPEIKVIGED